MENIGLCFYFRYSSCLHKIVVASRKIVALLTETVYTNDVIREQIFFTKCNPCMFHIFCDLHILSRFQFHCMMIVSAVNFIV